MKRSANWTTAVPTEPGFWWNRTQTGLVVAVHVIRVRGGLGVVLLGQERPVPFPDPAHGMTWRGPIAKPEAWSSTQPAEPGWYWVEGPRLMATIANLAELAEGGVGFVLLGQPWPPSIAPTDEVLAGCRWAPVDAPAA